MTPTQRDALQTKLDDFIWDLILALREQHGVRADLLYQAMMFRDSIEAWLDALTTEEKPA